MPLTTAREVLTVPKGSPEKAIQSPALEWLWKYLSDVPRPTILDCGAAKPQTVNVLLERCSKLHIADLISLLQSDPERFWDRSKKATRFLLDEFLARLPAIPPSTLDVILGWHLLDLLPREVLPPLAAKLFAGLRPGGVFFCLLREAYLKNGANQVWWLEDLTTLRASGDNETQFPYPVVSGRDVERLVAGISVKSFLTRSGRREVLVLK